MERGGLPEQFRDRLLRVLHHYGVEDLDRTPVLEESVFRIFVAQQRSAPEVALASAVLGRWIDEPPPTGELAGQARQLLERLGRATQLRFPVVGDLARSVRFRWFDQPAVDAERADVLAGVRDELDRAGGERRPAGPGRAGRGAGRDPGADRPVPGRAARGRRTGPGADAGGAGAAPLPRVRPPRPASRSSPATGRSWSPTTPSTPGPPGSCRPSARWPSWPTPSGGLAASVGAHVAGPSRGPGGGGRPVPGLARRTGLGRRHERAAPSPRRGAAVRPRRPPGVRRRLCRCRPAGRLLRLPARRRRPGGRGRPHPGRPPDGRPAPEPLAAPQLPRDPDRGARGRPALRVRRPGEPRGPAAGGAGPGAAARGGPRRGGEGHRLPARGARRGELPRGDPPGPGGARRRGHEARHEPRVGARLAGGGDRRGRSRCPRRQDPAAHRRRRHRGGARPGTGGGPGRCPGPR